jgi:hypothetical protein
MTSLRMVPAGVLLAFTGLALAACDSAPTAPLASAARTTPTQRSNSVDVNERTPVGFSTVNPCNGEAVELNGETHTIVEQNSSNGRMTAQVHVLVQSHYSGVGSVTGAEYTAADKYNETFIVGSPGAFNDQMIFVNHVIGRGNIPNYILTLHGKVTLTPNGQVTVAFSNFETSCQDD